MIHAHDLPAPDGVPPQPAPLPTPDTPARPEDEPGPPAPIQLPGQPGAPERVCRPVAWLH